MDPRNTVAMKDGAFGSGWRPRLGISAVSKPTGRRSFFRRGAAAAATALAAYAGREAFGLSGNPNPLAQPVSRLECDGVRGNPGARERPCEIPG